MTFNEVLDQARELLQSKGRVSYRALKAQFKLDDEALEALKDELIEAERVASDENSKVLVWTGASPVPRSRFQVSGSQPPVSYTPLHLAEQGQAEDGIQQIQQGMAAFRATGAELYRPSLLALLAEVYGKIGQVEEGLTGLAEALTAVDRTGERMYEAELYRLKGTLTLQSKASLRQVKTSQDKSEVEAEACFHKAIEIARKQQAKSLELRAVMSLSRLWQQQGKREEACQLLAEIYDWFTEGFDTKDLQEAKALLAILSQ